MAQSQSVTTGAQTIDVSRAHFLYVAFYFIYYYCSTGFDASRRGKKGLQFSHDENARHDPSCKSLLCVTPDMNYYKGLREENKGGDDKWDGKKTKQNIKVARHSDLLSSRTEDGADTPGASYAVVVVLQRYSSVRLIVS